MSLVPTLVRSLQYILSIQVHKNYYVLSDQKSHGETCYFILKKRTSEISDSLSSLEVEVIIAVLAFSIESY